MAIHAEVPVAALWTLAQYCVDASRPVKVCVGLIFATLAVAWIDEEPVLQRSNLFGLPCVVAVTEMESEVDETEMLLSSQKSLVEAAQGAVAPTRTVAVAAAAETAPNVSTALKVKAASPSNPDVGSKVRFLMAAFATVLGRSPLAIAVPLSFSAPPDAAGSETIWISFSRSLSASEKAKTEAANV